MYRVTYCCDIAAHKYSYKLFATKKEAMDWCRTYIGGLRNSEYEKLIDFVAF